MSKIRVLYVTETKDGTIKLSAKGAGRVAAVIVPSDDELAMWDKRWDAVMEMATKQAAAVVFASAKGTDEQKANAEKKAQAIIAGAKSRADSEWDAALQFCLQAEVQTAKRRVSLNEAQIQADAARLLAGGIDSSVIA